MSKRAADTLTVTKLPEWVRGFLEQRAELHGTSVSAVARSMLCESVREQNARSHTAPTQCAHTGLPLWPADGISCPTQRPHSVHTAQGGTNDPRSSFYKKEEGETPPSGGGGESLPRGVAPPQDEGKRAKTQSVFAKLGQLTKWHGSGEHRLAEDEAAFAWSCLRLLRGNPKGSPLKAWECARVHSLHDAAQAAISTPWPDPAPNASTAREAKPQAQATLTPDEEAALAAENAKRIEALMGSPRPQPTTDTSPEDFEAKRDAMRRALTTTAEAATKGEQE